MHRTWLRTTVTAVVVLYLQHSFVTDQVQAQMSKAGQENDNSFGNFTDSFDVPQDEGSGEIEPSIFNTTVFPEVPQADSLPHLVVKDASGNPCFLATLNATMQVYYRVPEGIVHETYIAFAEIQLPEDVQAQGVCGDNRTHLMLDWGNNTFHVNMTFTRNERVTDKDNVTWSLTDLAVSYDLSNQDVFPGSSETDTVTVERQHLNLFTTPVGYTYECSHEVKVQAGTNDREVVTTFHDVKIAAFGVTSSEFPSDVHECTEEEQAEDQEEILIPLIVACCLCAIVIIIVIAYVISRKVQSTRDQSEYRKMP